MVYFFSKAEKSNSLALTDCVNAFFLRLAGILKLRKKAGESSSKWFFVVFSLFPSPEFSCVRWVGKCLMKNRLSSSSSFLPSSSHYCKAMSLISLQLNCLTVPAFCYDPDKGAIVSSKVHVYYLCFIFSCMLVWWKQKKIVQSVRICTRVSLRFTNYNELVQIIC